MDSIDYSTPAPAAEAAASPGADPAAADAGTAAAPAPAEGGAATPPAETEKPNPVDVDDRVIELTKKARSNESRASMAEKRATAAEARVAAVEPVIELLKMAETDPIAFIDEFADIVNMTPERLMEVLAAKKSGGDVKLTADDEIARLKAEIAELKEGRQAPAKTEPAKADHAPALKETLEDASELFPECSKEGDVAIQAASILLEKNPGMAPTKALFAIEKTLRRKAAPQSQPAAAGNPTPPRTGGLSRSTSGAVVPAASGIPSDDEHRAMIRRALGGS